MCSSYTILRRTEDEGNAKTNEFLLVKVAQRFGGRRLKIPFYTVSFKFLYMYDTETYYVKKMLGSSVILLTF